MQVKLEGLNSTARIHPHTGIRLEYLAEQSVTDKIPNRTGSWIIDGKFKQAFSTGVGLDHQGWLDRLLEVALFSS